MGYCKLGALTLHHNWQVDITTTTPKGLLLYPKALKSPQHVPLNLGPSMGVAYVLGALALKDKAALAQGSLAAAKTRKTMWEPIPGDSSVMVFCIGTITDYPKGKYVGLSS